MQPNFCLATITTMSKNAEESMYKMLKRYRITIVLSFQSKMTDVNNNVVQEMRKFYNNFAKIQAELVVTSK